MRHRRGLRERVEEDARLAGAIEQQHVQRVIGIGPAESFRIRWREDAPGTWLYHCHVEDHMMHGMIGIYQVSE